MNTSEPKPGERIIGVRTDEHTLSADLADGRTITVPLAWYPRLLNATPAQRQNWQLAGAGYGIHWPDLDEDLSSEGLLRGKPAPCSSLLALAGRACSESSDLSTNKYQHIADAIAKHKL